MKIHIDYRTLQEELLNPRGGIREIDSMWNLLRYQSTIQACMSERGIGIIHGDICRRIGRDDAEKILNSIKSTISRRAINQSLLIEAQLLGGSFESAVEVACARFEEADLLLTRKPEEFSHFGLRTLPLDRALVERDNYHSRKKEDPILLVGGLRDLQRLQEFTLGSSSPQSLSEWKDGDFGSGWKPFSVENLYNYISKNERKRSNSNTRSKSISIDKGGVKSLDLDGNPANRIALLIDQESTESEKVKIQVWLFAVAPNPFLPNSVELSVIDSSENVFLKGRSNFTDENIQLNFVGDPGEEFSINVLLGSEEYVEMFII